MSKADLFVLSSVCEGFGNVLVEALGCGTPIVSTDCASGPAEILDDGRFGTLVRVGDSNGMAHAVLKALNGPRQAEALRMRAQAFSLDEILPQYARLLWPQRAA
jgi:glycosyltransferase involved in cell wall biosynthesis